MLRRLLSRLASSPSGILYLPHSEWGTKEKRAAQFLENEGFLEAPSSQHHVICPGCEYQCPMLAEFRGTSAFIVCDKRNDIGIVAVTPEQLEQHVFSLSQLAKFLAARLTAESVPQEIEQGNFWHLGNAKIKRKNHNLFLCRTLSLPLPASLTQSIHPLLLTLDDASFSTLPVCPLSSFIHLETTNHFHLSIERTSLEEGIKNHAAEEIAAEISWVNGEVVLINHVTGMQKTIARPNFDSRTERAFDFIFANAGKKLSEKKIKEATESNTEINLQKLLEHLGFKGDLRRIFFRSSKKALLFQRAVSHEQLAVLEISPASL